MARPGITYQEVAAVADSIIAEGDNPRKGTQGAELEGKLVEAQAEASEMRGKLEALKPEETQKMQTKK